MEYTIKVGCHDKYIRILRLLYDGMAVTVLSNGGSKSEPFIVETGVKQGCVIAPTLFAIFIAAILHLIGEELPQGIPIMYRTDGRLFNLNRFKAKSKVNCTTITELQYADDNVIAAHWCVWSFLIIGGGLVRVQWCMGKKRGDGTDLSFLTA